MRKINSLNYKILVPLIILVVASAAALAWQLRSDGSDKAPGSSTQHPGSHPASQNGMPHSEGDGHATHEIAKEVMDLTNQTQVQMDIKEFAYSKSNIRIKKGTTVTWTNRDDIQHNVMLEHEGSDVPHDPPTRDQIDPNEFAGPLLKKGESYSFTFNNVTDNAYHCSPHPFMKGKVTVVD